MNAQHGILVIFGLGKDSKPRLARFAAADQETALKAANAMGLGMGRAETPEAIALAKSLPEGKPFATGKSLLPLAKKDTYERLTKMITALDPKLLTNLPEKSTPADTGAPGEPHKGPYKDPWTYIQVGSVVLHRDPEPGPDRSWWEAVVTEISKDGKTLTMRWKNYPTPKPFMAKRISVAMLCKIS